MTARDAWGQVAHDLRALADSIDAAIEPSARADVATSVPTGAPAAAAGSPPPAAAPLPPKRQPESAFTECPAHRQPFKDGKFGPYCTGQSDDPNWSNDKGYCRVTPRSAGAWLKQHPKGAPAPASQDVDDIPF